MKEYRILFNYQHSVKRLEASSYTMKRNMIVFYDKEGYPKYMVSVYNLLSIEVVE